MSFSRRHRFRRKHAAQRPIRMPEFHDLIHPEHTGSESAYLKSLVDSHAKVTVVLKTGEQFHGHIRYYDRHCFSIGLSNEGPRIFLRKASVSYISEE
jgi:sRNA-binding regulator protein Hfq